MIQLATQERDDDLENDYLFYYAVEYREDMIEATPGSSAEV